MPTEIPRDTWTFSSIEFSVQKLPKYLLTWFTSLTLTLECRIPFKMSFTKLQDTNFDPRRTCNSLFPTFTSFWVRDTRYQCILHPRLLWLRPQWVWTDWLNNTCKSGEQWLPHFLSSHHQVSQRKRSPESLSLCWSASFWAINSVASTHSLQPFNFILSSFAGHCF